MGQEGEGVPKEGGEANANGGVTFVSVEFEVYGQVQGMRVT